jgi:hypothetical protein
MSTQAYDTRGPSGWTEFVAVVMFGDLECGYCKRSSAELSRLEATYGVRVLFVFKHFPMDPACNPGVKNRKHKNACDAAKASVCAQQQGLFWPFHDLAYKNQHLLDDVGGRHTKGPKTKKVGTRPLWSYSQASNP